ncbi:peptidase inhibitor family I36 protein [Streptomyces coeruleorubidus]|uniref:peptidase inhibitor family I36 protein n=1 Tax=Streptomyces coeruleorubidus TaxID=116188 RepID=UPI0033D99AE4
MTGIVDGTESRVRRPAAVPFRAASLMSAAGRAEMVGRPAFHRARRARAFGLKSIRDRGSSIRNNSDRTARVYEKRNHSGRHVCVTRSGGSIHDLRGYNLNDQTRSLKINRNDCG